MSAAEKDAGSASRLEIQISRPADVGCDSKGVSWWAST